MARWTSLIPERLLAAILALCILGCTEPAHRKSKRIPAANLSVIEVTYDDQPAGSLIVDYHGMQIDKVSVRTPQGELRYEAVAEYDPHQALRRVAVSTDVSLFLERPTFYGQRLSDMLITDPAGHLDTLSFRYDAQGRLASRTGDFYPGRTPAFEYLWDAVALNEIRAVGWDSLGVYSRNVLLTHDAMGKPSESTIPAYPRYRFKYRFDRDGRFNQHTWGLIQGMLSLPPEFLLVRLLRD
jgi:hypothetical protein